MSKVICDVCGTTFPDTAAKCPVCGSAKQSVNQTAAGQGSAVPGEAGGYTYVKGGRFSKRNVRRRNKKGSTAEKRVAAADRQTPHRKTQNEDKANPGLVAIVVILLLAIVAVVIYIAVRLLFPGVPETTNPSTQATVPSTSVTQPSSVPSDPDIPCTGLTLTSKTITLSKLGDAWLLSAQPAPADTTDTITYKSLNEAVATVDSSGKITAIAAGEAVIQVTCGSITEECRVVCSIEGPTVPSDPTIPTNPVDPNFVFEFNTKFVEPTSGLADATIQKGKTWKIYKGTLSVSVDDIVWLSDDPTVCVVEKGVATAVGSGNTKIHAVYNGTTYTCWFRVPNS